jgi:hypothetical protein
MAYSGSWTLQQQMQATAAGNWPILYDPYFYDVSLLLNGDGTNGAQNNTFLDSSSNAFTITRNGNTTQGSFSPYGSLWSNYFNGSSYLATSASIGSFASSFTFEGWTYMTGTSAQSRALFCIGDDSTSSGMAFTVADNGAVTLCNNGSNIINGYSAPSSLNQWVHWAVVRSGSTLTIYRNGTSLTTVSMSNTLSGVLYTGVEKYSTTFDDYAIGYISNLRVTNTAVYTTAFTPSTTPLTAISGTQYLGSQANRFLDASTNNATINLTGTPQVQRFSPFNPTAPYSTTTIGGSGYFDGSSYLTTPSSSQPVASGDFTISAWFYLTSFSNSYYVVGGNWTSGLTSEWLIQIQNNGAIRFLTNGSTSFSSSGLVSLNQWYYFSATRSGTTVTASLNGTSFASYSLSGSLGLSSESIYIGEQAGNNWPFAGYISDFRFVTSNLGSTVPTIPATAVSGTQLLTNFTNAGIPDLAMQNDLQTVGSAQVSTSVVKYGTGSIYTNGSGNYLSMRGTPVNSLAGTGNFTVEMWVYPTATPPIYDAMLLSRGVTSGSGNYAFGLSGGNTGTTLAPFIADLNSPILTTSTAVSLNTWTHIAWVRSGTTWYIFVNGTQTGTTASSRTFTDNSSDTVYLGASSYSPSDSNRCYTGYIDDARVTTGYARYTSNFTPPTSALPTY